ncbi:MAG: hypothetical protein V4489_00995 [Chlamydiota bacterium]
MHTPAVYDYYHAVSQGDYTPPSKAVQLYISEKIDASAAKAIYNVAQTLKNSREHESRVAEIYNQPRTAGLRQSENTFPKNNRF